ncbi:MAG TPA: PadR family transcriptional regulator [Variovorax sp.]|jgi:DNA-binding PadR family transcriptional regulator
MSLPHALLTALIEQSSSGSELARRFDRSIGFFWSATHQQIYRELGRLEDAGWVSSTAGEGRGGKKIYKVLPAGKRELKRWVGVSDDPRPHRDELMLRLRAEAVIGPTPLRHDIERRRRLHEDKLALYRELERTHFEGPGQAQPDRIRHLILEAGIMMEAMWVAWSDKALAVLDAEPAGR